VPSRVPRARKKPEKKERSEGCFASSRYPTLVVLALPDRGMGVGVPKASYFLVIRHQSISLGAEQALVGRASYQDGDNGPIDQRHLSGMAWAQRFRGPEPGQRGNDRLR